MTGARRSSIFWFSAVIPGHKVVRHLTALMKLEGDLRPLGQQDEIEPGAGLDHIPMYSARHSSLTSAS